MAEKITYKDNKEELQKKILQFQFLQQNLQMIQEKQEIAAERLEDLSRTKSALEELENVKGNALISIGSGNFVSGSITDTKNVIIGIGGGCAIKKTREGAIEFLDLKIKEIEKALDKISSQGQFIVEQLTNLRSDIEKLQK